MLGVFGSVPAFDTFFLRGFRSVTGTSGSFSRRSLQAIGDFYNLQSKAVDAERIATIDLSGQLTTRHYRRAKIIDMALLIEGGGR